MICSSLPNCLSGSALQEQRPAKTPIRRKERQDEVCEKQPLLSIKQLKTMTVQEQGLHRTHHWLREPFQCKTEAKSTLQEGAGRGSSQSCAAWQGSSGTPSPLCWLLSPPDLAGLGIRVSLLTVKLLLVPSEHSKGTCFAFPVLGTHL